MKHRRWPWQPREYIATVAALHSAEAALARLKEASSQQRAAQQQVRREISRRRRGKR